MDQALSHPNRALYPDWFELEGKIRLVQHRHVGALAEPQLPEPELDGDQLHRQFLQRNGCTESDRSLPDGLSIRQADQMKGWLHCQEVSRRLVGNRDTDAQARQTSKLRVDRRNGSAL